MRPDILYEVAAGEILGGTALGDNLLQEFLDKLPVLVRPRSESDA